MTHHCDPPVDPPADSAVEWTCPSCGRAWELRVEDEPEFFDSWYQPRETCSHCERCRWDPTRACLVADHPQCPRCTHCLYRHEDNQPEGVAS